MKEYVIHRTVGAPDWERIPSLAIDIPYKDSPDDIRAFAQIAYDGEQLYVHLLCEEKYIRAEETGLIGSPCEDSCLEFFFAPNEGDDRYFNIEFNLNGCMYLGFGSGLATLARLLPDADPDPFHPTIRKTDGGWEIYYTVPYAFVRCFFPDFTAVSGKAMRANCYKCSDLTVPAHYFSWNEITWDESRGERFTYHKPACFGKMIFE